MGPAPGHAVKNLAATTGSGAEVDARTGRAAASTAGAMHARASAGLESKYEWEVRDEENVNASDHGTDWDTESDTGPRDEAGK